MLVAIASYGTAQDHYLEKLLSEYRKIKAEKRIVVLTDRIKHVDGAELLIGLPSRNPYSLPFAHRKLFADNADKFDLFMYTEDDTLLTEKHIESFLSAQERLKDGEIAGFIRSETSPEGKKYITSINTHFRWFPDSVVEREGELFAQLSNQHSGCFIATRQQLNRAVESGGFLVEPYMGTYGMLESAASDIYTRCGLRRLICVSRIQDFIVPHLPNKYYLKMGIPLEELEFQTRSLDELNRNGRWNGSLFNPLTTLPGFRGSKVLFEKPDEKLLEIVPSSAKNLLSIGCGWGENELWLGRKGVDVTAVPIDTVFADALRRRGIRTVEGPFDEVIQCLNGKQFDAVLMADVLHLVENPLKWLQEIKNRIAPGGYLIAGVKNICEVLSWVRDWRDGRRRHFSPKFEENGVQAVSLKKLRRWCRSSGLEVIEIIPLIGSTRRIVRQIGRGPLKEKLSERFILKAKRTE
jgi:SAM-dependent methyltransferase